MTGRSVPVVVLSALTVAVLALGIVFGLAVRGNAAAGERREQALTVAGQRALTLLTLRPDTVEQDLASVTAASTDRFARRLERTRARFVQLVRTRGADGRGTVDEAAIAAIDVDSARVLLALTVRGDGAPRHYRVAVELARPGGRWLLSGMEFVP